MTQRRYVAVIDADESLCRSLARVLQQAGYQAITFLSAEDFLADPLRGHFACLLVDMQLGGISGIEMHEELIARGDATPVIYITAFDDPQAKEQALRLGSAGYFRKMESSAAILDAVRRATEPSPSR
jgi:FixJ family two-component response regulator